LRPNRNSAAAALSHDLRSLVPGGGGGQTVTAWDSGDPFCQPAYAAGSGGTLPTSVPWVALGPPASDPRSLNNIINSGHIGDGATQFINTFGYAPAAVSAPPNAAAVYIDQNGNPSTTNGTPLGEIVACQDGITATNSAGKIGVQAGTR